MDYLCPGCAPDLADAAVIMVIVIVWPNGKEMNKKMDVSHWKRRHFRQPDEAKWRRQPVSVELFAQRLAEAPI